MTKSSGWNTGTPSEADHATTGAAARAPESRAGIAPDLLELAEQCARDSHEIWAREQAANGWSWGPRPDETGRKHPALMAYAQLPDSEKQRLVRAATGTIGTLLASGFGIQRSRTGGESPASAVGGAESRDLRPRLLPDAVAAASDLGSLLTLWKGYEPADWAQAPEVSGRLAEKFLRLGEPLVAYDVASEALKRNPGNVRLRQILALALARSGASLEANKLLQVLLQEGCRDEETIGLLARTHKDLAAEAGDSAGRQMHLEEACAQYAAAHRLTGGYWSGINAATLAFVLGRRIEALDLARTVRARCRRELERAATATDDPYWILATLGEAALIMEDLPEAEDCYRRAAEAGRGRFGDLSTSRRNARLLLQHMDQDGSAIEKCFAIPNVVAFTGHMIDRPGRARPRFPAQLEEPVRRAIRSRLRELNAGFGYSSAACGSDILFLEELIGLNGEAHVVLPFEKSAFLKDSVQLTPGSDWAARFESILRLAATVSVPSEQRLKGGSVSYEYANLMLYGMASIRAEQLGSDLKALAVWDGKEGDGPGGTAAAVDRWRRLGHRIEIIDLREILRGEALDLEPGAGEPESPESWIVDQEQGFDPEIRALLFADAVGFSKLTEEELPRFVRHFLGLVGNLAEGLNVAPMLKNTWGDGLYFVFPDVHGAGLFALELRDRIAATDWSKKGLRNVSLRIGLHAGPVYSCLDPVTGRPNYIGAQVSRAARIEPITPPGMVYASHAFAALAAANRAAGIRCDYVGQTGFAKNYGTYPTYVVCRSKPGAALGPSALPKD